MADLPTFQFTTQEDWYYEIPFLNADAAGAPLALVDANGAPRVFVALITPAQTGNAIIDPVATLTMGVGNGITFKDAACTTLVFRLPKTTANTFPRGDYTADILEVVSGERHLFMPVRIRYNEPSAILSFLSRMIGVTFSASRQPIVTPVAIAGRQGIRGPGIFSGARAPTADDGVDGDFWVNASVVPRLFYGPKAAGAWPTGAPFVSGVAEVPGLVQALAGKATPADIAAAIATLTAGTPAELDTFLEAYNRFLADESAATALNAALGALQTTFTTHAADKTNPHAVTKAQVGLGSVANLAPADLPVSTAQAAADGAVQTAAAQDATTKAGAAQAAAIGVSAQRAANLGDLADKAVGRQNLGLREVTEPIAVTALNTLAPLANAPNGVRLAVYVYGLLNGGVSISPAYSVSGQQITWLATKAAGGFDLEVGDPVQVRYTY